MPQLNFYDVEAVKDFLLKLLIEVEELRADLAFQENQTQHWFARYRALEAKTEGKADE